MYLQNCAAHGKDFKKTMKIEMEWKAPIVSVGDIIMIFGASVINEFEIHWANHTGYLTVASPIIASSVDIGELKCKYITDGQK